MSPLVATNWLMAAYALSKQILQLRLHLKMRELRDLSLEISFQSTAALLSRLREPASWLLLLLFSSSSNAADFSYSSINVFTGEALRSEAILISGEIVPGDYRRLIQFIDSDSARFWRSLGFVLASAGGDVEESLNIARLVKGTYSNVFVGEAAGKCVSACFFIFAAAARREASGGSVGIHRPYISPQRMRDLTPVQAELLQNDAMRRARQFLLDLQIPTTIIDKMFARASTEVYWLSERELQQQVGLRPPWYEQYLIAHCGLDKSLEQRFYSGSDQTVVNYMVRVDDCGRRLAHDEAAAFLRSAIQK